MNPRLLPPTTVVCVPSPKRHLSPRIASRLFAATARTTSPESGPTNQDRSRTNARSPQLSTKTRIKKAMPSKRPSSLETRHPSPRRTASEESLRPAFLLQGRSLCDILALGYPIWRAPAFYLSLSVYLTRLNVSFDLFRSPPSSLAATQTDAQLVRSVTEHFQKWGTLMNVKVLKDWMQRPYSFVQFEV